MRAKPLLLIAALLLSCSLPAAAQYGPVNLLTGGTNNVPTNFVFYPSGIKISLGRYKEVGLHFEQRTTGSSNSPFTSSWAWKRSVDGLTTDSNIWLIHTVPLTGTFTNLWITNVSLPPMSALYLVYISNNFPNAYATNCLTNLCLKYLLRE